MTHAVCPVNGVRTAAKLPGNAVTSTGVPVDLPAPQLAQAVLESVLNFAMSQAVQVVPPVAVNVSVTEPAAQFVQPVFVVPVLYVPAVHAVHVVALAADEYDPAPQAVHAAPSAAAIVPVAEEYPAMQVHVAAPAANDVLPVGHAFTPRQLVAVPLVVHGTDPPLAVTR